MHTHTHTHTPPHRFRRRGEQGQLGLQSEDEGDDDAAGGGGGVDPVVFLSGADILSGGAGGLSEPPPSSVRGGSGSRGRMREEEGDRKEARTLGIVLHEGCETTVFNLGQCHRKLEKWQVAAFEAPPLLLGSLLRSVRDCFAPHPRPHA